MLQSNSPPIFNSLATLLLITPFEDDIMLIPNPFSTLGISLDETYTLLPGLLIFSIAVIAGILSLYLKNNLISSLFDFFSTNTKLSINPSSFYTMEILFFNKEDGISIHLFLDE